MNTQTAIAIGVAIIVVGIFLVFPGLSPFNMSTSSQPAATLSVPTIGGGEASAPSELQVMDEVVGTGAVAKAGDQISVSYVGMLDDGTVFDASANHGGPIPLTLGAGEVIAGWDQGILGMKEGGKRKLVIPANLAYGSAGRGNVIPPNATLTFEVELVKVTPAH